MCLLGYINAHIIIITLFMELNLTSTCYLNILDLH